MGLILNTYLILVTTLFDKWWNWVYTIICLLFQVRKLRREKPTDLFNWLASWQCSQDLFYISRIPDLGSFHGYPLMSLWKILPRLHNVVGFLKMEGNQAWGREHTFPHCIDWPWWCLLCSFLQKGRSLPWRGEGIHLVTVRVLTCLLTR